MEKLTKFEKEVREAEHQYFKVKNDIYGYKIALRASGVKKFTEQSAKRIYVPLYELPVNDYVIVKYRIPKDADIYVSSYVYATSFLDNTMHGFKKCRANEVEIVEIREIIEDDYHKIHVGKQYNGYAYSAYVVRDAGIDGKNIISVCSRPDTYGRCKKGQKLFMEDFFRATPNELFQKYFYLAYCGAPYYSLHKCETMVTCNRGFHFFMEETEALSYLLYDMLLR